MAININPAYVLTDANQTIVKLVNGGTGSNGRTYTKVNAGWCFCVMFYDLDVIDWYGIILVSNVSANAVAYKATDRYGTYYSATPATVNYNGETWYITYPDAYVQKDSGSVKNWSYADVKGYYPDWYVSQYNETELIGFLDEIFDKCTYKPSGGAGSGYIGNTLVSNKKMVGYNVPTSSAESTKTESVEDASESPVSGKPKIGNGYAKIKFLRDLIETNLSSLAKNTDFVNHRKVSQTPTDNISFQYTFADLTSYYLSDWILSGYPDTNTYQNGEFNIPIASAYGSGFLSNGVAIPIDGNTKIYGVKFDCKVVYTIDGSLPRQGFLELIKIGSGNTVTRIDLLRICRDPSTSYDPNNPSHRLAEDDLYHTYEFIFDSPVTFDYVHVNGSDVDIYIKNIKLLT